MTEKHDYTASVRGKGLDNTGVTEDHARSMYNTIDRDTYAVVRLRHARQINDIATGRKVELAIEEIEPIPDGQREYFQQILRTLHQNRVLTADDQQLQIQTQSDVEPSVEDVLAARRAHLAGQPHVFEGADEEPDACAVCGEDLDHDLHLVLKDPEVEPDDEEPGSGEPDDTDTDAEPAEQPAEDLVDA